MGEMIERKDVWRSLKTHFTDKERLAMAEQFASCHRERVRLEEELGSIKKQYASDIGKQEAEISSLAERLNTGWEMRRVECEEIKNFNNGSVRIYRKDGFDPTKGFFVEERPMSSEERQQKLPFGERMEEEINEILAKEVEESPDLPSQDAQDNAGQEIIESSGVDKGIASSELVTAMAETQEIIDKSPFPNELPDDTNPFYQKPEEEKLPEKPKKKVKRSLVLPD